MTMHKSLKSNKFTSKRNVRKRWERVQKLDRNQKWLEKNASVLNLPKETIERIKFKIKKEKMTEEEKQVLATQTSLHEKIKVKKKSKDVTGIR